VRQRPMAFNRATLTAATAQSKRRVEDTLARAERIKNDTDKAERLEAQLCKACFYFTGIGGAAMTARECAGCGEDQLYGSTNTDALCMSCASEHSLCKHCGGDLEMREGRRNWPSTDRSHT